MADSAAPAPPAAPVVSSPASHSGSPTSFYKDLPCSENVTRKSPSEAGQSKCIYEYDGGA
eukprot:scaffold295966_cov31-Prasinocladus_malaysianus.AAC.1